MKIDRHWQGVLQLVFASIGFGFLGIFGKIAFQNGLTVGALLTYRFSFAAVLFWTGALLLKPSIIRLEKNQILLSALLGIFGYAVFATLYFVAIRGLTVALASLLLYTYPLWVSLINHFLMNEKMTRAQWALLGLASGGLILLLWGHIEVHHWTAVAAGLGSALTYAIYILVSARWQGQVRPLSSSLYVISFAALALWTFHQPPWREVLDFTEVQATSILGIAVICTVLPLTLVLAGLQKMKSSEAALLTMVEPVTAALAAFWLFNERLAGVQLVGALFILSALALRTRTLRRL